jgi:hypothetical protein
MKKYAPIALVVLGLLQIGGDLAGVRAVKGVAAATAASPAPRVFSTVDGLETFSTKFFIEMTPPGSCLARTEITPERYSRMRGPYNRRNVYGAALAYAPVLPPELLDPLLRHALCGDAPLLRELGIEREHPECVPTVVLQPRSSTSPPPERRFQATCR